MKYRQLFLGFLMLIFLGLIYAWSIFVVPLENTFGWSRAQTSLTFTILLLVYSIAGVIGSRILKRAGVRLSILIGAILSLTGFWLASYTSTLWQLYLFYGGLVGFSIGMLYNAVVSTVNTWFYDNVGVSSGLLMMGYGMGSFVLAPIVNSLIDSVGWRITFRILGILFGILMGVGAVSLHQCPSAETVPTEKTGKAPRVKQYSPMEMLHSRNFYFYNLWAIVVAAIGLAAINHSIQIADEIGTPTVFLSFSVSLVSLGNGLSRVCYGLLYDRCGRKITMWIDTAIAALGIILINLGLSEHLWPFVLLALFVIGISYGGPAPINSSFARYVFGDENYGTNFSLFIAAQIPSSFLGGFVTGALVTNFGSYRVVLRLYYIFIIAAVIAQILLGREEKRNSKK